MSYTKTLIKERIMEDSLKFAFHFLDHSITVGSYSSTNRSRIRLLLAAELHVEIQAGRQKDQIQFSCEILCTNSCCFSLCTSLKPLMILWQDQMLMCAMNSTSSVLSHWTPISCLRDGKTPAAGSKCPLSRCLCPVFTDFLGASIYKPAL